VDCVSLGKLVANIIRLAVLFLLVVGSVCKADTWLGVGGGTVHFCHNCGYNNFNPGLGLQHDVGTDLRLIGGVYYNSYYRASVYGGVAYQPLKHGPFRFGIMGGVVSNYEDLKIPVMALPALSIEGTRIGVDILGFPNVGSRTGLITANFKYKL
jgi:hypothetical protein